MLQFSRKTNTLGTVPNVAVLEGEGVGIGGEGRDGGGGVAQVQDDGVVIGLVVHGAQRGVLVKHVFLCLDALIGYEFAGYADPLAVLEGANLGLGIGFELLVDVLYLAGLYVQAAFKNLGGAERANVRLVTVDSGQEIGLSVLEELLRLERVLRIGGCLGYHCSVV